MKHNDDFIKVRARYAEPRGFFTYQHWVNDEIASTACTAADLAAEAWSLLPQASEDLGLSALLCLACSGTLEDFRKLCRVDVPRQLAEDRCRALEYMVIRLNIPDEDLPAEPHLITQNCALCAKRVWIDQRYPRYVCRDCLADGVEVEGRTILDVSSVVIHDEWKGVPCLVKGHPCTLRVAHMGYRVVTAE